MGDGGDFFLLGSSEFYRDKGSIQGHGFREVLVSFHELDIRRLAHVTIRDTRKECKEVLYCPLHLWTKVIFLALRDTTGDKSCYISVTNKLPVPL